MNVTQDYYFKFDLTDQSLKNWPDLKKQANDHAATRVCVLVSSPQEWSKSHTLQITTPGVTDWSVVKIPSIDGTELWLIPAPHQEAVEKKIGFGKKSEPIVKIHENLLLKATFVDPFSKNEIHLCENQKQPPQGLSGLKLIETNQPWSKEKIEAARDTGDLAFEVIL